MRPPRRTLRALAGAVSAALICSAFLNGCSSSPQTNGTIAGAGSGVQAASTNTASAGASAAASLPGDLTLDVVMPATGDAAKDALLTKTKSLLYAYEQAIARANPNDPLYQSMVSGASSTAVYAAVQRFVQAGRRPTGVIRFSSFSVLMRSPAADVMFCEDDSRTKLLDTKTGVSTAPTGAASANSWDVGFLTLKGTSTIESVAIRPGGSACTG